VSDVDTQISRVMRSYEAAVFAKDAEAFMRLYHPAVRVFDAWGVWLYPDAISWRTAVEGWFASLASERVKVSFSEVQTFGDPSLATVSAIVAYAGESAQGEPLRSMQNRITWVLRETGHVFRIVHEHTSAPIGFEDFKAILARKQES
jgi:ketosteroid isomerase-like protein